MSAIGISNFPESLYIIVSLSFSSDSKTVIIVILNTYNSMRYSR